jgi:hypothetical protein
MTTSRLTTVLRAVLLAAVLVFFMIALGGLVVVLTFAALIVTVLSLPVLWFTGRSRGVGRLLAAWAVYLVVYLAISTGMAVARTTFAKPVNVGQEICADSGCFAVDSIDRTRAATESLYTLHWHLASTDKKAAKHFPGKGLELYLFDERGRKFALPETANPNPLDVNLPAGETVRESMTFNVPADAHELFLTAKYRPLTFQSLLPGDLSVVHGHTHLIRIQ